MVHISPTSKDYINPMDINMDYSDDDNPLGVKSDFVLSLCELIMGSRDGIEAEEKSVIDRCLPLVYQKYFADPKPENMPVLGDLYDCLRAQKEPQAQRIATALEIYVNGSLKVFNHRTNVELNNRIVCFDIKELGKQLKKIGMLIVQDQVWIKFLCRIKIPEHPVKNNILDFWWQLIKMMVIVNCLYQINHLSIFQMRGLDIRIFPLQTLNLDFISFLHVFPPPFLFLVFQLPPVLLSSSYIVSMIYRTYLLTE